MVPYTHAAQVVSISSALIAAGGIASLSLFDAPELQAQPASRSLPSIRWLFSRGSHIFPQAALLSSTGFAYLAYTALPAISGRSIIQILSHGKVPGYIAAAILTFGIAPFTTIAMIPTNFRLIELNVQKGGARSQKAEKEGDASVQSSAEDSVDGKGQPSQLTDLSIPQEKTAKSTTVEEDKEVRELLNKFGKLNSVRATLMAAGGVVGLYTALL